MLLTAIIVFTQFFNRDSAKITSIHPAGFQCGENRNPKYQRLSLLFIGLENEARTQVLSNTPVIYDICSVSRHINNIQTLVTRKRETQSENITRNISIDSANAQI